MATAKRKPPTSIPPKKYAPRGGTYSGPMTKPKGTGGKSK